MYNKNKSTLNTIFLLYCICCDKII